MTSHQSHFGVVKGTASRPRHATDSALSLSRFAHCGGAQYPVTVAETTAAGRGTPNPKADNRRTGGIFSSARLRAPSSMGGPWRGRLRPCRFPLVRCSNPVMCPPTPIGTGERVVAKPKGVRTQCASRRTPVPGSNPTSFNPSSAQRFGT